MISYLALINDICFLEDYMKQININELKGLDLELLILTYPVVDLKVPAKAMELIIKIIF